MKQAIGALLIIFGAMSIHIAASGAGGFNSFGNIWDDFLKVMHGEPL